MAVERWRPFGHAFERGSVAPPHQRLRCPRAAGADAVPPGQELSGNGSRAAKVNHSLD
jgi:hypothetical protein